MRAPSHFPAGLLAWVDAGWIPKAALLAVAVALHTDERAQRARWVAAVQRRLRRGDSRAWVAAAAGLVDLREVAPKQVRRARQLVAALAHRPPEARRLRLGRMVRLGTHPALFDALLAEARTHLGDSVDEAGQWLGFADEALGALRRAALPAPAVDERALRLAAAEAALAVARGELAEAQAAFAALADDPRRGEAASLALHAELWRLEAGLHRARRAWARAGELLERAERAGRLLGDGPELVRALLDRAALAALAGSAREAAERREEATRLADAAADPLLAWIAHHDLAGSLLDLGRPDAAAQVIEAAGGAFTLCAGSANRRRLAWLEGRIAAARGEVETAERHLRRADEAFRAQGFARDAALVRLDLAGLYLAFGQAEKLRSLARPLVAAFAARDADREALAAAKAFARAARAGRLTGAGVAALRRYFVLSRMDPGLRWVAAEAGGLG